jgi:hypothetical protein
MKSGADDSESQKIAAADPPPGVVGAVTAWLRRNGEQCPELLHLGGSEEGTVTD